MIDPLSKEQVEQASFDELVEWVAFVCNPDTPREQQNVGSNPFSNIGEELVRRLDVGQQNEVLATLERMLDNDHYNMDRLLSTFSDRCQQEGAWLDDQSLWYRLAEVMVKQKGLPSTSEKCPTRSPELSQWLRANVAAGLLEPMSVSANWSNLLVWPQISRAERLEVLAWLDDLMKDQCSYHMRKAADGFADLIASLEDAELLGLAEQSLFLRTGIFEVLKQRSWQKGYDWSPWFDYFDTHPDFYWEFNIADALLTERLWPTMNFEQRCRAVKQLNRRFDAERPTTDKVQVDRVLEQLLTDDASPFVSFLKDLMNSDPGSYSLALGKLIWRLKSPDALPLLLPLYAKHFNYVIDKRWGPYDWQALEDPEASYIPKHLALRSLIREILDEQPDLLKTVAGVEMPGLLPVLGEALLNRCLPQLTEVIKRSCPQVLTRQLIDMADQFSLQEIEQCGWLQPSGKRLMQTVGEVLLARTDPQVLPSLQAFLASDKLDPEMDSRVRKKITDMDGELAEAKTADSDTLAELEAEVAKIRKFPKLVENICDSRLMASMAPLSPHASRALLSIMSKAEGEASPLAMRLIAQMDTMQRVTLARYLMKVWQNEACHTKYHWLMELAFYLVPENDHDWVNLILDEAKRWNRKAKTRDAAVATFLIGLLVRAGSPYAWCRLQGIYEQPLAWYRRQDLGATSESLALVMQSLEQEAERRGISPEYLGDEVMPDFGLAGDAGFQIGDETYRVRLFGDLDLRVVNSKGKASKSVPSSKQSSADLEMARHDFKALKSALPNALACQCHHLDRALRFCRPWPLARWQRLFIHHPVMQQVGQTLIWITDSGQSFRFVEDASLLDVNDDPVTLDTDSCIRLWHPADVSQQEQDRWQGYFADYELTPWLNQFGVPARLPDETRYNDQQLLVAGGKNIKDLAAPAIKLPYDKIIKLVRKLGYLAGDLVGDSFNGQDAYKDHYHHLESENLRIALQHIGFGGSYCSSIVPVSGVAVTWLHGEQAGQTIHPADWPPALQATLFDHIQQIEALR